MAGLHGMRWSGRGWWDGMAWDGMRYDEMVKHLMGYVGAFLLMAHRVPILRPIAKRLPRGSLNRMRDSREGRKFESGTKTPTQNIMHWSYAPGGTEWNDIGGGGRELGRNGQHRSLHYLDDYGEGSFLVCEIFRPSTISWITFWVNLYSCRAISVSNVRVLSEALASPPHPRMKMSCSGRLRYA